MITLRKITGYSRDAATLAIEVGELARDVMQQVNQSLTGERIKVVRSLGTFPLDVDFGLRLQPAYVLCARAVQVSAPATVVTPSAAVAWEWVGGIVRINSITGLTAGTSYDLTLAARGGA